MVVLRAEAANWTAATVRGLQPLSRRATRWSVFCLFLVAITCQHITAISLRAAFVGGRAISEQARYCLERRGGSWADRHIGSTSENVMGVAQRVRRPARRPLLIAATPSEEQDAPEVKPDTEPTVVSELGKMGYNSLGVGTEDMLTPEDRITPVDRWMGTDSYIKIAGERDLSGFIDSSDESNYVTVVLPMPMGIEFLLNERGGGAMIGSLEPGYPAFDSGRLYPGFLLILVEGIPVYGKSLEEAMSPIDDRDGTVQLTFFRGDAIYFYGDYKPSEEWLQGFVEKFNANLDQ
mmetsp:Transcript_3843/g.6445  ORF Transcript_3843/g.6445 Transcript_3843/m.6445 type:complete len:292 (-) Transcript_3843:16-891(-)